MIWRNLSIWAETKRKSMRLDCIGGYSDQYHYGLSSVESLDLDHQVPVLLRLASGETHARYRLSID